MIALLMAAACSKDPNARKATPPEGAVDLGLSVFWATCNLGADDPSEYGDFYAWGETETKTEYIWENYIFRIDGDNYQNLTFTKYNSLEGHGTVDKKVSLDPEDDIAHVRLGDKWRMPSFEEFNELVDSCDWTWTSRRGIAGYDVKSRVNGNSIFLPSTGYYYQKGLHGEGYGGYYWTSSTHPSSSYNARRLMFTPYRQSASLYYRCLGQPIRPVSE